MPPSQSNVTVSNVTLSPLKSELTILTTRKSLFIAIGKNICILTVPYFF